MDFFRRIFRSKKRRAGKADHYYHHSHDDTYLEPPPPRYREPHRPSSAPSPYSPHPPHIAARFSPAARLPDAILNRIFSFVCPHSTDSSLLPAEDSTTPSGCMLCDMRDLSFCAVVCRSWYRVALRAQYTSIRIDNVHYCGLEDVLERKRKRGSVFQKKEDAPHSIPEARMRLLYRTFATNEAAAHTVRFLKLPYMTRETCKADLARLLSLTPGVRYVDLPDGVYSDDSSCAGIKSILYSRCPELRKMCWTSGSELSFTSEDLLTPPPWPRLEIVVLRGIKVEDADIVRVLSTLPALHDLTLSSLPWTTSGLFPLLPALHTLNLEDLPYPITAADLSARSATLHSLTLTHTTHADALPTILSTLPSLHTLTFTATITRPTAHPPPLSHRHLRTLKYELTSARTHTYYTTLTTSLPSLPALQEIYVREAGFHARVRGARNGLRVFEKAAEHSLEWEQYVVGGAGDVSLVETPSAAVQDLLFVPPSAPFLGAEGGSERGGHSRQGSRGSFSSLSRGDLWR